MRFFCLTAVISFFMLHPAAGECGQVRAVYRFQPPVLQSEAGGYSRIVFPGALQAGEAGGPSCPYVPVALLLPPGETIEEVTLIRRGWREIPGRTELYPRQHVRPGSRPDLGDGRVDGPVLVRAEAYAVDRWIDPPEGGFRTSFLRGHAIATGTFSPVAYNAAAGRAGYYSEVEVVIRTVAGAAASYVRTDAETLGRLNRIVDNPEALPAAGLKLDTGGCSGETDLLIVTRASILSWLSPLEDFYERRGLLTEILTVEDIEGVYPGSDTQEKIRNAVLEKYAGGLSYLLLAGDGDSGDEDSVPYRGLYCGVQSSILYEDADIPSDIYYAALDGDWNGDGDDLWGEPGEDDPYCEIAVGRMPVGSRSEVLAMIHKTTMYQESPVAADVRSSLMLGEHLWFDPPTWGGDEMDQLIGHCDAHSFVTDGIPVDFSITKYYDRDIGSWPGSTLWEEVNSGIGWVNHAGHSSDSFAMRINTKDVTTRNFTNDGVAAGYPIAYTYGCYAGAFDMDDCIGETMVTIGTFASAIICHSRYGWFTEGTTNGPSHHFQREFFDAIFTEGYTRLGDALARAKDETVPFLDLPDEYEPGAHRWCFYCLNLLGDPAMDAWTDTILPIQAVHAGEIGSFADQFHVDAGEPGITAALYVEGGCLGTGVADAGGLITVDLCDPIPADADSVTLTLTGHDRSHYRAVLPVVEATGADVPLAKAALLNQNQPNPFNPSTTISFEIPARQAVDLSVFDPAGRLVTRILDGMMEAGPHKIVWRPEGLASGIYFYVLKTGDTVMYRKAVLLR